MQLTTKTEPRRVEDYYRREGTLLAFEIPAFVGPEGLMQIASAHAGHLHCESVLDLVIAHDRCDLATLERVLELAAGSVAVLTAIATSGKASAELLQRLADSEFVSVREHAQLALVDRQLCEADDHGIERLYQQHRDHPSWGYGFRYRLVSDSRTPHSVLSSIASYRDPVAAQARRRLGQELAS